jgi:hypothetical protein
MAFACWKKRKLGYGSGPIIPAPTPFPPPPPPPPAPLSANWQLGPIINGKNYSVGTDWYPATGNFTWPVAQKGLPREQTPGPHYLTKPCSGIQGRSIRVSYTVTGDGKFFGSVGGQSDFVYLCVFFRVIPGDNWGGIDGFRWWSETQFPITPGSHTIEVALSHPAWVSVMGKGTPDLFTNAMMTAGEIGVTFGNDEGRGHGVSSETGNSAFVLESFEVVA